MAIAQNFPTISPSLLLDFANVQALDPRITFTRASTATYYGTETALAEQNLLLQSQTFDNASWGKIGSTVTADSTAAPDGTTTADTIVADGASSSHYVTQSFTAGATQKVLSVFLKAGTNNFAQIWNSSDSNGFANFDLSSGTVGTVGSSFTASIVSVGSGWYRCIAITSSAAANTFAIAIVSSGTAVRNETNALATTVFVWGAQLEQRSSVTAYTVTTTQPISNYVPVLETAASNVARFDHNPVTFESLGLLVEEQRTNLITYSEDYTNAAWLKVGATIDSNTIVAPDGTLTGDKLVESATSGEHKVYQNITTIAGVYTYSVFAKANGRDYLVLRENLDGNFVNTFFNLATGSIVSTGAARTSSIVNCGDGVYRCAVTATATAASKAMGIGASNNGTSQNYTGNGYSGIYIWGAQLEAGAFSTSYVQTVASQVTRAADSASMTGANFSSWYNQAEGSVYCEVTTPVPASTNNPGFMWYATEGINNRIELRQLGSGDASPRINALLRVGGVTTGNATVLTTTIGWTTNNAASAKISLGYEVNNVYLTSDKANAPATDLDTTMPPINQVLFSHTGNYKKIAYYPLRLTDTQLQALTG